MVTLGWCCWVFYRAIRPWRFLTLALLVSVFLAPERVRTLSFCLSFSAAAGVLQVLSWVRPLTQGWSALPKWMVRAIGASLGAQLGSLAWSAWIFQELPVLAVFSNLIAIPLVGFVILPAGLLSCLGVPGALQLAESGCEVFWAVLPLLEGPVIHPAVGPLGAFGLTVSIFLLRHPSAWCSVVVLSLGLKTAPTQGLRSTHFSVGQGDASLIEIDGTKRILIDAGPHRQSVLHALRRAGIQRIDVAILSHDHRDHSAGFAAILEAMDVGCLLLPEQPATTPTARHLEQIAKNRGISTCDPAKPFEGVRVLQAEAQGLSTNDRSLVVEIEHQGRRILFPGDLEATGEAIILSQLQPVDAVKIAHHGSRGSSTEAFLGITQPEICVISHGATNRYGHPHAETVERLESCQILQTALHGDVVLHLDPMASVSP